MSQSPAPGSPDPSGPLTEPATPPAPDLPAALLRWTRYRVLSRLGSGGMGEVFRAWDPRLQRWVALKFLHGSDPALAARFAREAQAQARVDHPRVCSVYEVGEVEGRPYIAMQEIHGTTLDKAAAGLTVEERVRLVAQVAEAVHAAHRIGLIHRDLKPQNVLVEWSSDGLTPFVVDFGLAREQHGGVRLTVSGSLTGTPGYMAPEQARGEAIDRRADVYSLGAVLYELLCGRLPLPARTQAEAFARLLQDDPAPPRRLVPSLPADLETVVMRSLEKDPARRYDSARALAEDLRRWLDGEPVLARRSGLWYLAAKRVRKHPRLTFAAAAAGLAILALAAVAVQARWEAAARASAAQRFGSRAKEMESLLRLGELAPAHDTRREREAVCATLAELEREMAGLGPAARGPGEHALGRGMLALGDARGALRHLHAAWELGERGPDVSHALGQALGQLYLEGLQRLGGREADAEDPARAELARRYREPARAHLRRATARPGALDSPELGAALLALHDERHEDALAAARRALAERPWSWEAHQVQGLSWRLRGEAAVDRGDLAVAAEAYERAGAANAAALAIARSGAGAHREECARRRSQLRLARLRRPLLEAEVESALAPCVAAARLHPGLAAAWGEQATILEMWAEEQVRSGVDPTGTVARSIAAAERDTRLDPADGGAWWTLGSARVRLGRWQLLRGADARPALRHAVADLRRATALEPRRARYLNMLGGALQTLARAEGERGVESDALLRESIVAYERAVQVWERSAAAWTNMGAAFVDLASRDSAAGRDPRPALRRAIEAFDRSLAINGAHPTAHNNRGNAELTLAEHQLALGEDPRPALAEAALSYRAALARRPEYAIAHWNLSFAARLEAEWLLRSGRDPSAALDAAAAALAEAARINPADSDNAVETARQQLVRARWELGRGRSPATALARAAREIGAGLALNGDNPAVHLAEALRLRWLAEWEGRQGGVASAPAERGLLAAERALELRPDLVEALAVRVALLRLAGRAPAAETALASARSVNPLVRVE